MGSFEDEGDRLVSMCEKVFQTECRNPQTSGRHPKIKRGNYERETGSISSNRKQVRRKKSQEK